ncbi:hypothetical protein THAOC_17528, partial [Thalassiosira oceanica]
MDDGVPVANSNLVNFLYAVAYLEGSSVSSVTAASSVDVFASGVRVVETTGNTTVTNAIAQALSGKVDSRAFLFPPCAVLRTKTTLSRPKLLRVQDNMEGIRLRRCEVYGPPQIRRLGPMSLDLSYRLYDVALGNFLSCKSVGWLNSASTHKRIRGRWSTGKQANLGFPTASADLLSSTTFSMHLASGCIRPAAMLGASGSVPFASLHASLPYLCRGSTALGLTPMFLAEPEGLPSRHQPMMMWEDLYCYGRHGHVAVKPKSELKGYAERCEEPACSAKAQWAHSVAEAGKVSSESKNLGARRNLGVVQADFPASHTGGLIDVNSTEARSGAQTKLLRKAMASSDRVVSPTDEVGPIFGAQTYCYGRHGHVAVKPKSELKGYAKRCEEPAC